MGIGERQSSGHAREEAGSTPRTLPCYPPNQKHPPILAEIDYLDYPEVSY